MGQTSAALRDRQPVSEGATLTEAVWSRLRRDVLSGALGPGERLPLHRLRGLYGAGSSPLREALWRLCAEGLVTASSHRGFQVSIVPRDELADVVRLRVLLECEALEEAIAGGDEAWEAAVLSAFHRLSKYTQADGAAWDERHQAFHEALVMPCRSPVLQRFRRQLYEISERHRQLARRVAVRPRDDLAEHRAIMEACLARDEKVAKTLMGQHLRLTANLIMEAFEEMQPPPRKLGTS